MAHEAHSAGGDHEEHHVATSKFVYVFIALCVLTTASIVTYTPLALMRSYLHSASYRLGIHDGRLLLPRPCW